MKEDKTLLINSEAIDSLMFILALIPTLTNKQLLTVSKADYSDYSMVDYHINEELVKRGLIEESWS